MLRLGSHVSMKAPDMLLGSANEAASYGANTFMIYTGAPQNTRRKPIDELKIDEAQPIIEAHDLRQIVVHAPYIINLGNTKKLGYFEFATDFLYQEIQRADAVGATQLTLHPGAHIGAGADVAIAQIIKGLNAVIRPEQHVQIALETMAGKGTEVGRTFEELAQMIDGVTYNEKLSVTFDTCHTSDAGYAIKDDFDGVLNEFDHVIGLDRLKVIHLNDSKNPQGAHKDRHTNIGMGTIGFDTLNKVAHHPQLPDISKILETPYVGEDKKHQLPPYKYEIAMLRAGEFNPHLIEDIEQQR
ncbi:putative endonuclease 4 [Lactiplantibacillus plantarum]|uniref:deoxyribonuclease IV n=1 Tax=Lactiplantibacillus plantarum TaxID=1590 RepID=UPI00106DBFCF|nr:deoxyribonuclease IV [Lactiplantibacillus plantarum]VFI59585.1 putative endonuclease 4 [Lactiplantibacillus plantarum]VFI59586.1 putative endonuclease 4 [Lactiplantibacillus plantarum]